LNTQVAELHKALLGDKDEYQESNEFGDNSILNDLRLELQQIGGAFRQTLSEKFIFMGLAGRWCRAGIHSWKELVSLY
jgi:hypothetical protein